MSCRRVAVNLWVDRCPLDAEQGWSKGPSFTRRSLSRRSVPSRTPRTSVSRSLNRLNRQYCRLWSSADLVRLAVLGHHHFDPCPIAFPGQGKVRCLPHGGIPHVGGAGGVVAPCNFRPPRGCGDGAPLPRRPLSTVAPRSGTLGSSSPAWAYVAPFSVSAGDATLPQYFPRRTWLPPHR